jgi:hypothetical protein
MSLIGQSREEMLQDIARRMACDPDAPHTWPSAVQHVLWAMEQAAERERDRKIREFMGH